MIMVPSFALCFAKSFEGRAFVNIDKIANSGPSVARNEVESGGG